LEGYSYSPLDKAWIKRNANGKIVKSLPEFPPPASSDTESLQTYLSGDWLKLAEHFGDVKDASIRAHNDYVEKQAAAIKNGGIGGRMKDFEHGIQDEFNKGVDKVKETLKDGEKKVKDGAKNGFEKLKDEEQKIQAGVTNGVKNGMEKLKEGEKRVEDLAKEGVEKMKETVSGGKKSTRRERSRRSDKSKAVDQSPNDEVPKESKKPKRGENSKEGEEDDEAECVSRGCRDRRRTARSKSKKGEESTPGPRGYAGKLKEGETEEPITIITRGPPIFENADDHDHSRFVNEIIPKISQSTTRKGHFDWKTGNWSLTTTTLVSKEWRPSK